MNAARDELAAMMAAHTDVRLIEGLFLADHIGLEAIPEGRVVVDAMVCELSIRFGAVGDALDVWMDALNDHTSQALVVARAARAALATAREEDR
jgi:hypothetical protein